MEAGERKGTYRACEAASGLQGNKTPGGQVTPLTQPGTSLRPKTGKVGKEQSSKKRKEEGDVRKDDRNILSTDLLKVPGPSGIGGAQKKKAYLATKNSGLYDGFS